jgi:hypothetical protein
MISSGFIDGDGSVLRFLLPGGEKGRMRVRRGATYCHLLLAIDWIPVSPLKRLVATQLLLPPGEKGRMRVKSEVRKLLS